MEKREGDLMKKLGFGCMRFPLLDENDPQSIDIEQVKKMFDVFLANGFTYVDTAYPYHEGMSEKAVKEALVDRYPREAFLLADKLPTFSLKKEADCPRIFQEQLTKTGAGYFDFYLIHCLTNDLYEVAKKCKAFEFVKQMKEAGKVKQFGFSFHDTPEKLDEILNDHPEVDFVQLQINYLDWEAENVQSKRCYEVAKKHGKEIVIMEPIKGGSLIRIPEAIEKRFKEADPAMDNASWAIRFAASLPKVRMVLSGMSNLAQMEDNISYMKDFQSLSPAEMDMVLQAGDEIRQTIAIPCTACEYCVPGCPKQICIPDYFKLYNERQQTLGHGKSKKYDELAQHHGKASDCIECGQCEGMCPQHLPIIEYLKKTAESFEA